MACAESSLAGCQKGRIMRTEGAASIRETAAFAVFFLFQERKRGGRSLERSEDTRGGGGGGGGLQGDE